MGKGLAHARILELRVMLVEHGEPMVGDQAALHLESRILLDAGNLVRRHVADKIELAGEEPVDAAGHFRHHHDAHGLHRRAPAPVVVMRV